MVQEGCPYVAARCCVARRAVRRLERAQHVSSRPTAEPRPRRRREGDREAQHAAYQLGDGLPREARHPGDRLAPLPRAVPRHAQLAPVVRVQAAAAQLRRRRVEPADLVHGRAASGPAAVRPDAAGVPRPRPLDQEHPGAPGARRRRNKPADANDPASTRTARCSRAARTSGTGSSTAARRAACAQAFPPSGPRGPSRAARSRAASSSATLQPVKRALAHGLYGAWSRPTRRSLA